MNLSAHLLFQHFYLIKVADIPYSKGNYMIAIKHSIVLIYKIVFCLFYCILVRFIFI